MIEPTNTELIAQDLGDLYLKLTSSRRNPKAFRHYFEQYLVKSQQLTDVMRREYKQKKNKKWVASSFSGWSSDTNLLKALRNTTVHGLPISFYEVTIAIYPLVEFSIDTEPLKDIWIERGFRAYKSVCFINMPFSEKIITQNCGMLRKHKVSNNLNDIRNYVLPLKQFISYEIQWELFDDVAIRDATVDAVKIVLKSYPVLKKYYEYYVHDINSTDVI